MKRTGSYDDRELLYADAVSANPKKTTAERIAINAYVAEHIQSRRSAESYDAIAAQFGFSKATAINVALHGKQVGLDVTQNVANVLFDGSLDALKKAALDWWESEQGDVWRKKNPNHAKVESDKVYPNRGVAIQCGRLLGFDERAFTKIRGLRVKAATDPPARWWFKQLEAIEAEVTDPYRDEPGKPLKGDPIESARKHPSSRK